MLKTVFNELIGSRIAGNFALWIKSKGYSEEGNIILKALASWANKEVKRLESRWEH